MSPTPTIKPEWLAGITMTQAQKDAWLVALRSGQYQQADSELCVAVNKVIHDGWGEPRLVETLGYRFCCLGVAACAVLGRAPGLTGSTLDDAGFPLFIGPWVDADDANSSVQEITSAQRALAYLNDRLEYNFEQIADFIEVNIPACDEVRP